MLIGEFLDLFESKFPSNIQEEWDNSGLQVGDCGDELKGILLCVDVSSESVEMAESKGCNLIISHHPIIFDELKSIEKSHFIGKKIFSAIEKKISIYSTHTAIDANGLNFYVFKKMGYASEGNISMLNENYGYGDFSETDESVLDIISKIKDVFNIDHALYYGDYSARINKVGLVTGSGMDFLGECINKNLDLYITADVKHHDALDAVEQGLNLLDIGHYDSEKLFIDYLEEEIYKIDESIKTERYYADKKYIRRIV
ncbi:MAG: Nif3-like dinuclear metal center hexameric protein [Tissierellia bacterium]|nr:Nif3-like dinuclear metal center hexameric protein [Tissierellia bacterium]